MDVNRRHLIGAFRRRCRRRAGDVAGRRARRAAHLQRSGATPRNMACGPAAPTIRPAICSARSMKPRARRCRWRCRRASIAPACCACQAARNWSACAARPSSCSAAAPRCCRAKAPAASACQASRSTAAASRCRRGAAWCIASADAMSASPIARSPAAAATASGWSRSPATSPATSSPRSRPPRWCRSMRSA